MESSKDSSTHTVFSAQQFSAIYPEGIGRHYWSLARNMIVADVLSGISPQGVLDVGAGAGVVASHLRKKGFRIWGVEPAPVPVPAELEGALFTGKKTGELPAHIRGQIDTVLLLDVIEHIGDPQGLIREVEGALPNLKKLIITVPARREIWSNYDEFNGHYLRYDRSRLVQAMKAARWDPAYVGYCFHGLYWPALLLAKLGIKRPVEIKAPSASAAAPHRLLASIFYWEYKLLPRFLIGSSIIAVFNKPGSNPART